MSGISAPDRWVVRSNARIDRIRRSSAGGTRSTYCAASMTPFAYENGVAGVVRPAVVADMIEEQQCLARCRIVELHPAREPRIAIGDHSLECVTAMFGWTHDDVAEIVPIWRPKHPRPSDEAT